MRDRQYYLDSIYPEVRPDTLRVALLLPLFDNGTLQNEKDKQIASAARDFYRGAQMGLDSMAGCGANIEVDLYDTRNDSFYVALSIRKMQRKRPSIVVGPMFSQHFYTVQQFSRQNRVTFVSPLVDLYSLLDSSPYFVSIPPSDHDLGGELARLVNERFQGTRIMLVNQELKLKPETRDELPPDTLLITRESRMLRDSFLNNLDKRRNRIFIDRSFDVYDIPRIREKEDRRTRKEDEPPKGQLDTLLVDSIKTIIVITSQEESFVSAMVNNFSQRTGKVALMGLPKWKNFRSIYSARVDKLNLHLISDYHINYRDPAVTQFVRNYRSLFYDEPNSYAFRGFATATSLVQQIQAHGVYFQPRHAKAKQTQRLLHGGLRLSQRDTLVNGYYNHYYNWLKFENFEYKPLSH